MYEEKLVQGRVQESCDVGPRTITDPRPRWVPRQSFDGEGRLASPERRGDCAGSESRRADTSLCPPEATSGPLQSDPRPGSGLRFRVPGRACRRLRGPKFCGSVPLEKTDRFATTTFFPCRVERVVFRSTFKRGSTPSGEARQPCSRRPAAKRAGRRAESPRAPEPEAKREVQQSSGTHTRAMSISTRRSEKGSEFEGKLAFEGKVRIDGTFTGEIRRTTRCTSRGG